MYSITEHCFAYSMRRTQEIAANDSPGQNEGHSAYGVAVRATSWNTRKDDHRQGEQDCGKWQTEKPPVEPVWICARPSSPPPYQQHDACRYHHFGPFSAGPGLPFDLSCPICSDGLRAGLDQIIATELRGMDDTTSLPDDPSLTTGPC